MSKIARHPRDPAVAHMGLEEIADKYCVRFSEI
jgi:hypothetical protein